MSFLQKISAFFNKYTFNAKWRCVNCQKEIFNGEYFCEDCKSKLPYNYGAICHHCGRKLINSQNYCTTCKGRLTNIDKARSAFNYELPISSLIKRMKYDNHRYLVQAFGIDLANIYYNNGFRVDLVAFVPATKKSLKKRGYNQSRLLAEEFCTLTNLPLFEGLEKVKETNRQAKLNREDRAKNLKDAFKLTDKRAVRNKNIIIIDDVSTTGATAETLARLFKQASANEVYLLSVASVPPKCGY